MTQKELEAIVLDVADLVAKTAESIAVLLERTLHSSSIVPVVEIRDKQKALQAVASSTRAAVDKFREDAGH